jgi:hypothetical protein
MVVGDGDVTRSEVGAVVEIGAGAGTGTAAGFLTGASTTTFLARDFAAGFFDFTTTFFFMPCLRLGDFLIVRATGGFLLAFDFTAWLFLRDTRLDFPA